jgi:hypothetical protein
MVEVQAADPRARRAALIVLAVAFVVGSLLLWALNAGQPAVARWLRDDPARTTSRARLLLAGLALLTSGPALAAGLYLWRLGARIVSAERFPPPGLRMVQDTTVLTGDSARSRGRLFQGLGLMLFVAGTALALLLVRLSP